MAQSRKRKGNKNVKNVQKKLPVESKCTTFEISLPSKAQISLCILVLILSTAIFTIGSYYVQIIHENERSFSELSELEREITFRSETGLYYYFYKSIIRSDSFKEGFANVQADNKTEYPDEINGLNKYRIYPEILIGLLYRTLKNSDLLTSECSTYKRDDGFTYDTCVGLEDPAYFYLQFAWYSAGFTAVFIFLFGFYLSDSIFGGLLSVLSFFYNHVECSRVQWTPTLRETFGYPLILLQMLVLSLTLDKNFKLNQFRYYMVPFGTAMMESELSTREKFMLITHMLVISTLTFLSLLFWQLSQYIFITQIMILVLLFLLRELSIVFLFFFCISSLHGVYLAAKMTQYNELFMSSNYTFLLITIAGLLILNLLFHLPEVFRRSLVFYGIPLGMFLCHKFLPPNDDMNIYELLQAKFNMFKDFHTQLVTCSAEYNFLNLSVLDSMTYTALLPTVLFIIGTLFLVWLKSANLNKAFGDIELPVVYNLLQTFSFCILAVLFMRLKLFSNSHLCVLVSLFTSKYMPSKLRQYKIACLFMLIIAMSYQGVLNISKEFSNIGTFSYPPLENLLNFINKSTPDTAVFAGPISITSAILLSTNRSIVIHPPYEGEKMRTRVKEVYSIFSRKPEKEVFQKLNALYVDYVVVDYHWCFTRSSVGCLITDSWDLEDENHKTKKSFCSRAFENYKMLKFVNVYRNEIFSVLKLKK